jgi:hypothetical protein
MLNSYIITFGQNHVHRVNGKIFDCDSVCQIDAINHEHARKIAFDVFKDKFCFSYEKSEWMKSGHPEYYPRGIISLH